MNCYGVYDKVLHRTTDVFLAENNGDFLRRYLNSIIQNRPLRDLEYYVLSRLDKDQHSYESWNDYSFPESKAEALSPLELSEKQKEILSRQDVYSDVQ